MARLTESAFRRLEVVWSSLGIYSTKYYPPARRTLGFCGVARFWGSRGGTEKGLLSPSHSRKNVKTLILFRRGILSKSGECDFGWFWGGSWGSFVAQP